MRFSCVQRWRSLFGESSTSACAQGWGHPERYLGLPEHHGWGEALSPGLFFSGLPLLARPKFTPLPQAHPLKDRLLQPTRASHWWLSPFCSAPREPSRTQALAVQEGAGGLSSASSLFWVYQERAGVTGKKKPLAIDCSSSLAAPCSRSEKAHLDADVEQERPSRPEQTRPALLITQSSATAGSGPGNSH